MINISKYGESLGVWDLEINNKTFNLKPKKGDNKRFREFVTRAKDEGKGEKFLFESFEVFIYDIIARDYVPENDVEKEELALMIEYNINELLEKTMIAFKWTTKRALEKEKEALSSGKKES